MGKNLVNITKTASKQLSRIAQHNKDKNVIFSAKGGGCSHSRFNADILRFHFDTSYRYDIEPMNFEPYSKLKLVKNDDYNLFICDYSLKHLENCTIDWKEGYMGQNFHFTNPSSTYDFACGKSFMSKHKY